ncbi:MAG TPA: permease-like cell division protein FtsX [Marmoricola sp.]|jgi:cell division transport system permease protein
MQLRYVFSETGTGLRRNVSMSIALVVTIFVSLTLVGMALLLNSQAKKTEESWGSKLQITVYLCNQNSRGPQCTSGEVTAPQKAAVVHVLKTYPEVASFQHRSKEQAFQVWKKIYVARNQTEKDIYSIIKPSDMQESYQVTLKDPQHYRGLENAVVGLSGVDRVQDLREVLGPVYFWIGAFKWGAIGIAAFLLVAAILQVANTIRLATYARRREIGIMRLVGASSLYISLPFLMETLIAGVVGILLSFGAIAVFMRFVVYDKLRGSHVMEWVNWSDALWAFLWIAVLGVVLAVVPTLLMSRKYLKV